MNFTFNSESYGTTVEINFEATTLDEIRDMFDQFLRGSGFYFEDEDDVYTSEERVQKTDKSIHEPWDTSDMAYRPNGLSVEQEKMCVDCGKQTMHMGNKCYGCCQTAQPEQAEKQEPVAQCTNSDTWNCKYCRKTKTCEALKDSRNFGEPTKREWVGKKCGEQDVD